MSALSIAMLARIHGCACLQMLAAGVALVLLRDVQGVAATDDGASAMFTEEKNLIVNSAAGGDVIINGVVIADLVSAVMLCLGAVVQSC